MGGADNHWRQEKGVQEAGGRIQSQPRKGELGYSCTSTAQPVGTFANTPLSAEACARQGLPCQGVSSDPQSPASAPGHHGFCYWRAVAVADSDTRRRRS
jgi:hypothetical protein